MNQREAAQKLKDWGELFTALAPHLEKAGTLEQDIAGAEMRLKQLNGLLKQAIEDLAAAKSKANTDAKAIRDAADVYAKTKRDNVAAVEKEHGERIKRQQQQADAQMKLLDEKRAGLHTEISGLAAKRDELAAKVAEHRAYLADAAKL